MLTICDKQDASRIANPHIRALLDLRYAQLGTFHDGLLVVVEVGDAIEDVERLCGVAILHDPFSDVPFGHPDYSPPFDFVVEHNGAYEMHFDASDDGIGTTLLIPKGDGIDAELLALCRDFAVAER
jgi:hypothetical protein